MNFRVIEPSWQEKLQVIGLRGRDAGDKNSRHHGHCIPATTTSPALLPLHLPIRATLQQVKPRTALQMVSKVF